METFENIKNEGRLLYKYTRGSTLYGLNTPESDLDEGGLFIASKETFFGLPSRYEGQVSDERNDTTWYEIGKFSELLLKSNATVLEALFIPEDKMLLKPNKLIQPLFEVKESLITKDCFKPFVSYAIEQINKARGLSKKIVNPITERKWPLDFCYTFRNQGSTKIKFWLEYRSLKQEYCGLVNIPNMHDVYGVYYDWGRFFEDEGISAEDLVSFYHYPKEYHDTPVIVKKLKEAKSEEHKHIYEKMLEASYKCNMVSFIANFYGLKSEQYFDMMSAECHEETDNNIKKWFNEQKPIGYRGIVGEKSNGIRLSSVSKGEKPISYLSYNENGYTKHCVDYKNYQDWVKYRNPKRYESNLSKNYDSKNMMHCMRLISMGQEIAEGKGIILDRREAGDREFLMNIRNHKYEYDELMKIVNDKKAKMDEAIAKSNLPDHIDKDLINDILVEIRKNAYNI